MEPITRLTGENFLKRSGKGHLNASLTGSSFYLSESKVDSYPTLIQILKSDLIKIQDMIKYNSSDIKMYKLLSKTPGLTKKLTEIEENKNLNLEKLTESSKNIDRISKICAGGRAAGMRAVCFNGSRSDAKELRSLLTADGVKL